MAKAQLKVHTENILPIIKKWLYSEKDIFIRELVSNGCDALGKCRVLRDQGEANILDEEQISEESARKIMDKVFGVGKWKPIKDCETYVRPLEDNRHLWLVYE